ncbi:protein kinase domain-containing protein [Geodermatophilus sp. CPCC 205506]|uniref:protein kinase domain-containing protein n=1 Tax=Geodermatophilus sp. CPCC 205506 TaxID=2936596 RepID=UPI003EEAB340
MVEPGGRTLGERYELAQLIAAGGMGQVWRGTDALLGRQVAVKVLRSEYTGDPTFRARFRAEAQHSAALSHPHIAAVFDYGETEATDGSGEKLAYLVMELVEGEPLSAVLRREGRLDAESTLSLLEQAASALAEAHRVGLVHRDVKPGNILVRDDGSVKITDFGIAWSAGSVPLTRTGQVIGTPQYLSPEQAEGRHATPASDVYALGLVGYECLTGHPAFDGDNPVTIALKQVREEPDPLPDDLPREIRTLIRRALCKNPEVRMPDGAAFVEAIDDVRAGRPLEEPPATCAVVLPAPPPPALGAGTDEQETVRTAVPAARTTSPPPRRHRRSAAVLVPLIALLVGAGVAAGVFAAINGDRQPLPQVAAQTEDAAEIVLDPADYVGRPVNDVALSLSALGLIVQRKEEVTADAVPDMVTSVDPVGRPLRVGDDVVVAFAVAPPPTRTPNRGSTPVTGVAGEETPAPEQEEAPAPVEESAAPASPTPSAPTTTPSELPASMAPTSTSGSSSPPTSTAPTTTPTTAPTSSSPSGPPSSDSGPPSPDEESDRG